MKIWYPILAVVLYSFHPPIANGQTSNRAIRSSVEKTVDAADSETTVTYGSARQTYIVHQLVPKYELREFQLKDNQEKLPAFFVQFDGEDVVLVSKDGTPCRMYKQAFAVESLAAMQELETSDSYRAEAIEQLGVEIQEITKRIVRQTRKGFLGPFVPVEVTEKELRVIANKKKIAAPLSAINASDLNELAGSLYRAKYGVEQDKSIDARLKIPVSPDEVLREPVALSVEWQSKLERLLVPSEYIWKRKELNVRPGEEVVSVSADGQCVIIGQLSNDGALSNGRVENLQSGTTQPIKPKLDAPTLSFLTRDHDHCVVAAGTSLKLISLVSGDVRWESDKLSSVPTVATQSKDGNSIIIALADGNLVHFAVDSKAMLAHSVEGVDSFGQATQLWCSNDGLRIAVLTDNRIRVFRVDSNKSAIRSYFNTSRPPGPPLVSFGEKGAIVGSSNHFLVQAVDVLDGKLTATPIVTGIKPVWLNCEDNSHELTLHVIGKAVDQVSQKATHLLSIWIGSDSALKHKAQSIDMQDHDRLLVSQSGNAVITRESDRWFASLETEKPRFQFEDLKSITKEMVLTDAPEQLDAAWRFLRSSKFEKLGSYPEEGAEIFLESVSKEVGRYQWQHGGDLENRQELLLTRWGTIMPTSSLFPLLRAMRARSKAWQTRGSGYADTVAESEGVVFQKKMQEVLEELRPLIKRAEPASRVFDLSYDVAKSLSLPSSVVYDINKLQMKSSARFSPGAHSGAVLYLMPRWHGKPGESEKLIEIISDELGGDIGDGMYMRLIVFMSSFFPNNEPLSKVVQYSPERLLKGLKAYYNRQLNVEHLERAQIIFAVDKHWDEYRAALELQVNMRFFPFVVNPNQVQRTLLIEKSISAKKP